MCDDNKTERESKEAKLGVTFHVRVRYFPNKKSTIPHRPIILPKPGRLHTAGERGLLIYLREGSQGVLEEERTREQCQDGP